MRKITLILFLFLILFLTGCGLGHIEDINGEDDYSLATLSEENLIKGTNSSSSFGSFTSTINNKFTQKVKKMSGTTKVVELNSNRSYSIEFLVKSGNGLIGIVCNDEIIKLVNPNTNASINVPSGKDYVVKIVGESCEYELVIIEK